MKVMFEECGIVLSVGSFFFLVDSFFTEGDFSGSFSLCSRSFRLPDFAKKIRNEGKTEMDSGDRNTYKWRKRFVGHSKELDSFLTIHHRTRIQIKCRDCKPCFLFRPLR